MHSVPYTLGEKEMSTRTGKLVPEIISKSMLSLKCQTNVLEAVQGTKLRCRKRSNVRKALF